MPINPKNIVKLLCRSFDVLVRSVEIDFTNEETFFALHLEELIKDAVDKQVSVESYTTLEFFDENIDIDPVANEDEAEDEELERGFEEKSNNKRATLEVSFEYKKEVVDYWCSSKKGGKLKFETVKNRYKMVNDEKTLYRWQKQVLESGTRRQKLLEISKFCV
ncbi:hypothetical protein RF55_23415 [Lasius niger]|uniref:Uncharacterized protein n=1 Tax=Lasius niger TaxID=67767 RepID=A0A0J7JW04_LASNI|nr:hypothetical protein RF55_23415 [Lasius niger]